MTSFIKIDEGLTLERKKRALSILSKVLKLTDQRNHVIIDYEYSTDSKSKITLWCSIHDKIYSNSILRYQKADYGIRCCSYDHSRQKRIGVIDTPLCIIKRAEYTAKTRNHEIKKISGYTAKSVRIDVYCCKHDKLQKNVSYASYTDTRRTWGVHCCSRTNVTKIKKPHNIKIENNKSYYRHLLYLWNKNVVNQFETKGCYVTGFHDFGQNLVKFHYHHLYGQYEYPKCQFVPENGISMCKKLHIQYHKYTNSSSDIEGVTPTTFVCYLKKLINEPTTLKKIIQEIFINYLLTDWHEQLMCFDMDTYRRIDMPEPDLSKIESVWFEQPNIPKLFSAVQKRIETLINKIQKDDILLSAYLLGEQEIPQQFQNPFLDYSLTTKKDQGY